MSKFKYVNKDFNGMFSKVLLNVTLPATILNSVLTQTKRPSVGDVITVFIIATVMYILLPFIGMIAARFFPVENSKKNIYAFMIAYGNVGFMGFPVISALFGETAVLYTAIFNILFNVSCYTFGAYMMSTSAGGDGKLKLGSLLNPGFIVTVFSLVVYFMKLTFPAPVEETVEKLGNVTTPMAMFLIGSVLATNDLKAVFMDKFTYVFSILRQVVLPVVLLPILTLFVKNQMIKEITFILLLMPCANSAVMFANEYGADDKLASRNVFITTVMAIVTIPVCMMIFL